MVGLVVVAPFAGSYCRQCLTDQVGHNSDKNDTRLDNNTRDCNSTAIRIDCTGHTLNMGF